MSKLRVNIVTGRRAVDWVLADLLQRLVDGLADVVSFTQTPEPVVEDECDVYFFYRQQAAASVEDLSDAVLMCHGMGKRNKRLPGGRVVAQDVYQPVTIRASQRAALVITLNTLDSDRFHHVYGVSPKRTVVIPHAVDPDVFTLRPKHNPGERLVVGVVGRPYGPPDDEDTGEEQKGRATLRAIMRGLDYWTGDLEWLFLGDGWDDELELARGLGYEATFWRRGEVQYPVDFVRAYHRMDVYLVTSRSEGGPASLPEAMACGVWPLCTPVGMCFDALAGVTVPPCVCGMLYPVNGHKLATRALLDLTKPDRRVVLEASKKSVRAKVAGWTWERWADAHLRAFLRVYGKPL